MGHITCDEIDKYHIWGVLWYNMELWENFLYAFYLRKIIFVQLFHGISLINLNRDYLFLALEKNQALLI